MAGQSDFTPEEEEEVCWENQWAFVGKAPASALEQVVRVRISVRLSTCSPRSVPVLHLVDVLATHEDAKYIAKVSSTIPLRQLTQGSGRSSRALNS